jgi:hypothetical protein
MDGRHFVRLIVPAVLALGIISAERHEPIRRAPIDRELDDGSPAALEGATIAPPERMR